MDKVTIVLTAQELNVIGAALGEIPFKVAASVVKSLNDQVNAQLAKENQDATIVPSPPMPDRSNGQLHGGPTLSES